jgi:hypothetical protein
MSRSRPAPVPKLGRRCIPEGDLTSAAGCGDAGDIAPDRQIPVRGAGAVRRSPRVGFAIALSVVTPLLVLAVSGVRALDAAWKGAEAEALRAADAAAEYVARVLDGLTLRADMANELLRGIPDAEIRAREREFHERLRAIPLRTGEGGAFHLFVHDRQARSLASGTLYPAPVLDRAFLHRDFNLALRASDAPAAHVSRVHMGEEIRRAFFAVSRRR